MPLRGAVIMVKGDWAEYTQTLGLASWSSPAAPCPFCTANKDNWQDRKGLSPVHFPHELMAAQRYEDHCGAAELRVWLTQEDHLAVARALFFDRREGGAQGASAEARHPRIRLAKGRPARAKTIVARRVAARGNFVARARDVLAEVGHSESAPSAPADRRDHRHRPQQLRGRPTPRFQFGPYAATLSGGYHGTPLVECVRCGPLADGARALRGSTGTPVG